MYVIDKSTVPVGTAGYAIHGEEPPRLIALAAVKAGIMSIRIMADYPDLLWDCGKTASLLFVLCAETQSIRRMQPIARCAAVPLSTNARTLIIRTVISFAVGCR